MRIRINGNTDDAAMMAGLKAEHEAHKYAMRDARSCKWAETKGQVHYRIEQKKIVGTEKDAFYIAEYCLLPEGTDKCLWLTERAKNPSPFKQ
jgi:hypothetical protein